MACSDVTKSTMSQKIFRRISTKFSRTMSNCCMRRPAKFHVDSAVRFWAISNIREGGVKRPPGQARVNSDWIIAIIHTLSKLRGERRCILISIIPHAMLIVVMKKWGKVQPVAVAEEGSGPMAYKKKAFGANRFIHYNLIHIPEQWIPKGVLQYALVQLPSNPCWHPLLCISIPAYIRMYRHVLAILFLRWCSLISFESKLNSSSQ